MGGLDLIMTCYNEVSDQQFYEKRGTDEVLLGFVIHAPVPTTPMLFVTTIVLEILAATAVASASPCIVYAWRFANARVDYATLPGYSYRPRSPTVISPLPRVQSDEDDGYMLTRSGTPNTSSLVGEWVNSSPIPPRSSRNS